MEPPKAIHFASSHLHWITQAELSHGFFRLEALLEWFPSASSQSLQFVLSAAIPAGRMYASSGTLLKLPPYSFQLIAGALEHTILRRPLDSNQPIVPVDSSQLHTESFQTLNCHLSHAHAQLLTPESLAALPKPPPILNVMLELQNQAGLLRLQAPLRHWNHRADPSGWQIETGPLLWPLDRAAFEQNPSSLRLSSVWLHANQAGRVTISGDRLLCHELEAQLSLLALT